MGTSFSSVPSDSRRSQIDGGPHRLISPAVAAPPRCRRDMDRRSKRVLGASRSRKTQSKCGICGRKTRLSKAHIPAQCAGNTMLVKRYRTLVNGDELDAGRGDIGGIYLYGLCKQCNSSAGTYDVAYGQFADALRPLWARSWELALPPRIEVPPVSADIGAVARSILLAMCATGSFIQTNWPGLPKALIGGAAVDLPDGIRLYLALSRGRTARVAGPVAGFYGLGPKHRTTPSGMAKGINAIASVYFPPVAWELVQHDESSMLLDDGWADVTDWTMTEPGSLHDLPALVGALPAVCHPSHHPRDHNYWFEVFAPELTEIVECANVDGGPVDASVPLLKGQRSHLDSELIESIATAKRKRRD